SVYNKKSMKISNESIIEQNTDYLNYKSFFNSIQAFINNSQNIQIVADTCLSSFPSADLRMNNLDMYFSNPIWLSIGQSIPASIGAYLANGKVPIIITGDGGFQMLATTYSTMVKYKIPALILIIDNALYAIEQYLIDSSYFDNTTSESLTFNKLNRWEY